jgi:hypothetical protein
MAFCTAAQLLRLGRLLPDLGWSNTTKVLTVGGSLGGMGTTPATNYKI